MHILFLLEYFKPHVWWAETLFDNVIAGLVVRGYDVIVLTSKYTEHLASHETISYDGKDVTVHRVGHNRYDFMRYGLWKAMRLLKKHDIDLVQTTTFNAALVAGILRLFVKIPTVLHVHEVYVQLRYTFFWGKGFFYRWFERLIFRFTFDHYTCSSLYTKNSLRLLFGIPDRKLTTTYCGIDYELRDAQTVDHQEIAVLRTQYQLEDAYVGLYFGRPGIAKGLLDYLEAIPEIVSKIPQFKAFLIVPKTEQSHVGIISSTIPNDEVGQLIARLGITEQVIWIDSVKYTELKNYVMMADVVVLPTMAEWFGLAIAEVCALQKPLVTTNVGTVPEVVGGQVQLVEPANHRDIARGVVEIWQGEVASLPKKEFLRNDCVEKFISVYTLNNPQRIILNKEKG